MSTILECKNLSKKYGRKQALDNITLSLESGRIIGLGAKWQWKDYFNQVNQRITCSNRRKTFYQWKYPWSRIEKNRLLSPRAYLLR